MKTFAAVGHRRSASAPLLGASLGALKPARKAAGHAVGGQGFMTSAPRLDFKSHVTYGSRAYADDIGGGFVVEGQTPTQHMALALRASGDYRIFKYPSAAGPHDTKAAHDAYVEAHRELVSSEAVDWGLRVLEPDARAWMALGFVAGPRKSYINPSAIYLRFSHAVVKVVQARGGVVHFHFGFFCMHQFMLTAARVEIDHRQDFSTYAKTATVGMLTGKERDGEETEPTQPARKKAQGTVTGVELVDFAEGQNKDVPVLFRSGKGLLLDGKGFRKLYAECSAISRSETNKEHLSETGHFTPLAREATEALQAFVHGFDAAMPSESELWADPTKTLGREPSRWKPIL